MKFTLQELIIVGEVLKSVPSRTPNRIDVVLEYVRDLLADVENNHGNQKLIDVEINYCEIERFQLTLECIAAIQCFIPVMDAMVISRSDGTSLAPTFALPSKVWCCGKTIKILSRHANLKLYDVGQVRELKSYHGKCQRCKTSYYHGFSETSDGKRFFNVDNCNFLMFTSGLAFSKSFLKFVDGLICIGGTTFEAAANVYNHTVDHNHNEVLNSDRLEAAWYLYRTLDYITEFSVWPRKPNHELDVEALCKMVYPQIKEMINKKWINHICEEKGCQKRAIVIDGNEKLYRFICASEKTRVIGNAGEVNRYDLCIRNPVKGNKSTEASKYCLQHLENKSAITEEQMDLRPITRSYAKNITKCPNSEEGCKKTENINSYYDRTAGMFYIFRPCGIRLSHAEMYTSESCSDAFVTLIDLFGANPDPKEISLVAYDRVCDLHPFVSRLSREGNSAAGCYEKLLYILDAFHAKNHVEPKCVLSNEECIYHPDLPRYDEYKGMNTQIAEQSFNKLNKFKYMTRKMSYCRRLLFFKYLDDTSNSIIEKRLLRHK